jgi:hypothetical protein
LQKPSNEYLNAAYRARFTPPYFQTLASSFFEKKKGVTLKELSPFQPFQPFNAATVLTNAEVTIPMKHPKLLTRSCLKIRF